MYSRRCKKKGGAKTLDGMLQSGGHVANRLWAWKTDTEVMGAMGWGKHEEASQL